MNMKCSVIEDLLPLYVDGICSKDTKELVEVHLKECTECNEKYIDMTKEILPLECTPKEGELSEYHSAHREELVNSFSAKKAFKKLRRRLVALVICILLIIPNIFLGVNQVRGEGICYTNIPVVIKSYALLSQVKKGNYEKAFDYLNIPARYNGLIAPEYEIRSLEDLYRLVTIGSRDYYVDEQTFLNEYAWYIKDKDESAFWTNVYRYSYYIIPEEQYKQMRKDNLEIVGEESALITSSYGNYYVPSNFTNSDSGSETLENLAGESNILPVDVYLTALEKERKQEEAAREWRRKYIDMGYSNYYKACKEYFVTKMEDLSKNGIIIAGIKLRSISRYESYQEYELDYDLIFKVDGKSIKGIGVSFRATDGKILFSSTSYVLGSEGEKLDKQFQVTSAFLIKE